MCGVFVHVDAWVACSTLKTKHNEGKSMHAGVVQAYRQLRLAACLLFSWPDMHMLWNAHVCHLVVFHAGRLHKCSG